MITSQHARRRAAAVWRTARRAAAGLRAIHHEQVLMWELFCQSSRVPADRAGPLAWEVTLDGPRLSGSHLPFPADADDGPRPGKESQRPQTRTESGGEWCAAHQWHRVPLAVAAPEPGR